MSKTFKLIGRAELEIRTYEPEKKWRVGVKFQKVRLLGQTMWMLSGGLHKWAAFIVLDVWDKEGK